MGDAPGKWKRDAARTLLPIPWNTCPGPSRGILKAVEPRCRSWVDLGGIGVFLGKWDGSFQPEVIYDTTGIDGAR